MTLDRLNEHFALIVEYKGVIETLEALREQVNPQSPRLDGMPHGSGVKDRVGTLAAEIVELERYADDLADRIEADEDIFSWIDRIRDPQTKIIFRLRYKYGYSWCETAAGMGPNFNEKAVKVRAYRYIQKSNEG